MGFFMSGHTVWLADVCTTVLILGSHHKVEEGQRGVPLGINLSVNFVGNQYEGSSKAVPTFIKRGKTVSRIRTTVG